MHSFLWFPPGRRPSGPETEAPGRVTCEHRPPASRLRKDFMILHQDASRFEMQTMLCSH